MGGGGEGGSNGGGEKELIETVLTCEGCITDPELPLKISRLIHHLQIITYCESSDWQVRKVEPWNSVRVTFSIPKEAANRLHQLAQAGDAALRQLGILSVQVEGDQIVSLKVAGPNNETAEIVLRAEGTSQAGVGLGLGVAGPSGENTGGGGGHPSLARSVTHALGSVGMLPGFSQTQHHQPHPVPQFRSPSLVGTDGIPVVVGRSPVGQQRPIGQQQQQQGFAFAGVGTSTLHARHPPQPQPPPQQQPQPPPSPAHPSPAGVLVSGGAISHPSSSSVVARPVFPTNPPPPYPNQELRNPANPPPQPPQQPPIASQMAGQPPQQPPPPPQHQYVVPQTSSVITPPPQAVLHHPPQQQLSSLSSLSQSVTGGYRVPGNQVSVASSAGPPGRSQVRTQVNMVKNSPLLVGLLQQPEQSSTVGSRNPKSIAVNPSQTTPSASSSPSTSLENGPLPSASLPPATTLPTSGTYIGRSRDGFTTHQQIFSGGSVITNSVPPPPPPPPRHPPPLAGGIQQQQPQHLSAQPSSSAPASRLLNSSEEHRRGMAQSSPAAGCAVAKPNLLCSGASGGSVQSSCKEDGAKESKSVHFTSSVSKKESQYLINPNTGLLEPRPNTDSSDSEPEGRTESPSHDDQRSNSLASDEESNLSAASRKETDHSDSDVSRVSVASVDSKKLVNSDRGKSQDRDSSPGSSWENSISPSQGEKIRLRLKLGKEQVAQATIVGNATKKAERRELPPNAGISSSPNTGGEPRVPKLHIKLHSSQPVIIKPVEESEAGSRKSLKELPSTREDKGKRKSGRSKPRNSEVDLDSSVKSKNVKLKMNKDNKACEDEVTSQVMKILESKRTKQDSEYDDFAFMRFKETPDGRVKVPRMLEVTKPAKVESKLKTRLKKTPMRKVGDLNSLGEIASHKIMETLPPSITKVAAMHTQQPHRNPNASSPIPFSSIATSMFSGSSISASFSASPVTTNASTSSCIPSSSSSSSTSSSTSSSSTTAGGATSTLTTASAPGGDHHLKVELEKRGSEIIQKTDVEKNGGDVVMTKLRVNSPAIKNLMNGDVSHTEKMTINQMRFKRAGSLSSQTDFPSASKLTIKRKNPEETHALKALKKEGLGSVPTFLNSSVLINKVSPDKSSVSSLSSTHRQSEDLSEKLMKKVESINGPLRNEIAGLKSNSDITIHSVSKGDILGLSKGSDFDRRAAADLTLKTKPEVTKVGRVTCVDVMDRKALEEALKSSRNSSKKNDVFKSTSCMVDRLRRWNSIDSSNPVPLSSHSHQQASESTNLNSASVKTEPKESGDSESEKPVILSTVIEKVKTESGVSQQSTTNTIINVNSDNDCDNSGKDISSSPNLNKSENKDATMTAESSSEVKLEEEKGLPPAAAETSHKMDDALDECSSKGVSISTATTTTTTTVSTTTSFTSLAASTSTFSTTSTTPSSTTASATTASNMKAGVMKPLNTFESADSEHSSKATRDQGKIGVDSVSSISMVVKSEVESPEGTPKGEHGNGHGGEDSGIESMDALSEKSPNHSDQSPNRREDKECEMFQDKCKVKANPPGGGRCPKMEEKEVPEKKLPTPEELRNSAMPSTTKSERGEPTKAEDSPKDNEPFEAKLVSDTISSHAGAAKPSPKLEQSSGTCLNTESEALPQSQQPSSGKGTDAGTKSSSPEDKMSKKSESDSESSSEKLASNTESVAKEEVTDRDPSSSSGCAPEACQSRPLPSKVKVETSGAFGNSCPPSSVSEASEEPAAPIPDTASPEFSALKFESTSAEESTMSSSHDKFSDPSPVLEPPATAAAVTANSLGKAADTGLCSSSAVDFPVSTVVCSVSLSITTTSLSVASPKTTVVTSPSVLLHPSVSVPSSLPSSGASLNQPSSKDGPSVLLSKESGLPVNSSFKPSLLAITLSRPPGASIMTSQYATSIANSIETMTSSSTPSTTQSLCSVGSTSTTTTTAVSKIVSSLDSQANSTNIVYCHSLSCNNNSLAYSNSYTTSTNTTATMIILAASTSSSSTTITTPPNSTKVVTLKPGLNQSSNSAINPPVGKTFRLVALPGINSMTPAASPVKGQLVTLKPVVGSGVTPSLAKSSQLLQTVPAAKSEDNSNSSILKTQLTSSLISSVEPALPSAVLESISNEGHLDDLDFVGFSNISETEQKEDSSKELPLVPVTDKTSSLKPPNMMSPTEEEPTPMRVHPPLYTYGNRERKKDVELDAEERERDPQGHLPQAAPSKPSDVAENDPEAKDDDSLRSKSTKDKKLHALTIEIPNTESFPDDKRLTRSTRQSARLASPKVNSPASGELSPRNDKRSPATAQQTMGKPSPVGVLRSSVSPALRVAKRRRHESESSSASNVSEDQVEPPIKASRRKASAEKPPHDVKEDGVVRNKGLKREIDHDKERDGESSDDECLIEDEGSKRRNLSTTSSSTNEDEEESSSRPSSRTGRPNKALTRTRDRTAAGEVVQGARDTTPTRRTPRQNRVVVSGPTLSLTVNVGIPVNHPSLMQEKQPLDSKEPLKDAKEKSPCEPLKGEEPPPPKEISPKEGEKKTLDKKVVAPSVGKEGVKSLPKLKKESETDSDATTGRRKTRSTTNTATVSEDGNKRRRICKDK